MAKKLESLLAQLPPEVLDEAQREAERQRPAILALMALQELRKHREMSQEQLAETLGIKQSAVSRLERRTDMYVSTLKELIEGLGGELHVIASFPEGDVEIAQFTDLGKVVDLEGHKSDRSRKKARL
ncbi:MAG TPA: helix-turn-helix domain-containing protein [Oscillatoriaceae cyanobacterium]